jgi:aspartyl-tRNA(Asn)/glutamyl-tRNA(Gln) amidotransferase subunit A
MRDMRGNMRGARGLSMRCPVASGRRQHAVDGRRAWQDLALAERGDLGRGIGRGEIDPVALTEAYLDAIAGHPPGPHLYRPDTGARPRRGARRRPSGRERASGSGRSTGCRSAGRTCSIVPAWRPRPDRNFWKGACLRATRGCCARHAGGAGLPRQDAYERAGLFGSGPQPDDRDTAQREYRRGCAGGVLLGCGGERGLRACGLRDRVGYRRIGAYPLGLERSGGAENHVGAVVQRGRCAALRKFDTVGPLARSVEDCALMLAALEGKGRRSGGCLAERARGLACCKAS